MRNHLATFKRSKDFQKLQRSINFTATPVEIRALRAAMGWSQPEFAAYLGISTNWRVSPTISKWENGHSKPHLIYRNMMEVLCDRFYDQFVQKLCEFTKNPNSSGRKTESTTGNSDSNNLA